MKWLTATLLLVPVLGALLAGWLVPGAVPPAVTAPARSHGPAPAIAVRDDASGAVSELAAYIGDDRLATAPTMNEGDPVAPPSEEGPPPQAPVVYMPPPPPPPPPPPDVGVTFRRQITGVVAEPGGGLAILLADRGAGVRRLRVGDRFAGAWTLVSLSRDAAVLSDGEHMRRVPFFGGPMTGQGVIDG